MSNPVAPAAGTSLAAFQIGDGSTVFKQSLVDSSGAEVVGLVSDTPASNSLLGRLKAIVAGITDTVAGLPGVISAIGATASADRVVAVTPSDTTALSPVPKALVVLTAGNVAVKGTDAAAVTVPVVAGQVLPLRARYVMATNTTATVAALI